MYYSEDATKEWIWATFGVMLCLSAAWASLIEILFAGILLLIFIAPWLLEKYEEEENTFSLFSRKWQQKTALWGSVIVVSTYLILTLVILLGSIDSVNFEAHELYGAPFILAFAISMMIYLNRKNDPKSTFNVLSVVIILSIILAVFFPHALGSDSDSSVSNVIDSAPGALDTLNELAAAINDDASFHTTITTALSNRVRVDTSSQGLTSTQKSNARTNMGLGTLSTLSAVDISDNTNLSASSPLSLTGDTLSIANIPFGSLHADAYQTSSES